MMSGVHDDDAATTLLLRDIGRLHRANVLAVQRTNALLLTASTVFQAIATMLAPHTPINIDVSDLLKDRTEGETAKVLSDGGQESSDDEALRQLLIMGATQLAVTLPYLPDWLATDRDGRTLRTLQGIVTLYGYTLLREPQLRRTWRRIAAALHNVLEQTNDPSSHNLVHYLLQHIDPI